MADTVSNIIVGAATISVGAYVASGGAGSLTDVGAIVGGATIDPKRAYKEIKSDHHLGTLALVKTGDDYELKFAMEESTLGNLLLALDQPSANLSGGTLRIDPNASAVEKQVQVVTRGTGATNVRTVTAWKCVFTDVGAIPFKKDGEQMYQVTVRFLQDLTVATADKVAKVVDT